MHATDIDLGLYEKLFPPVMLLCLAIGTLAWAMAEPAQAFNNYLAAGLGLRFDDHFRRRRWRLREEEGAAGWARTRSPV
jgi:hypothetical protein